MVNKVNTNIIKLDGHDWEIGQFENGSWGFRQDDSFLPFRETSKYEAELIARVFRNYEALLSANKKALLCFNYMSTLKFSQGKDKPVRDLLEKVIKQAEEE